MTPLLLLLAASPLTEPCERHEMAADWRKAYRCYGKIADRMERTQPRVALNARYREGLALWYRGQPRRAERRFRRVVEQAPYPAHPAAVHASLLLLHRSVQRAKRCDDSRRLLPSLKRIIDLDVPDVNIDAFRYQARLLNLCGRYREAKEAIRQSRRLETENGFTR